MKRYIEIYKPNLDKLPDIMYFHILVSEGKARWVRERRIRFGYYLYSIDEQGNIKKENEDE